MRSINDINIELRNKYQTYRMIEYLDEYNRTLTKALGFLVIILLSPLYLLLGVAYIVDWVWNKVDDAIGYLGDSIEGLIGLVNALVTIGAFKLLSKSMLKKSNQKVEAMKNGEDKNNI